MSISTYQQPSSESPSSTCPHSWRLRLLIATLVNVRVGSNCFHPIIFVGICGVLVLITAFPTLEWVVVAAYLDADREVGVGIPTSSLPMLALDVVHYRAVLLTMSSLVWLGEGGNDENELWQSHSSFSWRTHWASHFLVPLSCSSPPKSSIEWWWAAHIPLERGGVVVPRSLLLGSCWMSPHPSMEGRGSCPRSWAWLGAKCGGKGECGGR